MPQAQTAHKNRLANKDNFIAIIPADAQIILNILTCLLLAHTNNICLNYDYV